MAGKRADMVAFSNGGPMRAGPIGLMLRSPRSGRLEAQAMEMQRPRHAYAGSGTGCRVSSMSSIAIVEFSVALRPSS